MQPGSSSTARYGYDAGNKRVWRGDTGVDEIAFWAGQKLATYQISTSGSVVYFTLTSTNVYFGGKLISKGTYNSSGTGDKVNLTPVAADRLGSIGKFYPYGTERPSATANDKEKFTGYFRDASTGLDYADQRYHQPGMGRFMTPDSAPSAKLSDPGSWNRYAYVGGDPSIALIPRDNTTTTWGFGTLTIPIRAIITLPRRRTPIPLPYGRHQRITAITFPCSSRYRTLALLGLHCRFLERANHAHAFKLWSAVYRRFGWLHLHSRFGKYLGRHQGRSAKRCPPHSKCTAADIGGSRSALQSP